MFADRFIGVVPEAAGSLLMPIVMGNQRAAEKLYTGDWISAAEAVECGLALRAVGQSKMADEFVATMNHAAEQAVPVAAHVFAARLSGSCQSRNR